MKTYLCTLAVALLSACSAAPVTDADRAHMREVERRTPSGVLVAPARASKNAPSRGIDKR
jgi:hypothetical protein